jgi:hypothetical protein
MSFSIKSFVRSFKNVDTLNAYFDSGSVNIKLSDKLTKEERVEYFIKKFNALPLEQQSKIQSDFIEVDQCSNEQFFEQFIVDINSKGTPISQEFLDSHPSLKEKFLYIYLHYPKHFNRLDLEKSLLKSQGWLSFNLDEVSNTEDISADKAKNTLPKTLSTSLFNLQQRGGKCIVEGIEYEGRLAFIALPEDYATSYMEYDEKDQLNKDNLRTPIFKIYFIYDSDLNILRVKSKGGRSQICLYAELFITAITGADEWVAQEHIIKAYLTKIFDPNFSFTVQEPFEGIYVKGVTFDLEDSRITFNLKRHLLGNTGKLFMERLKRNLPTNILEQAQEIRSVKLSAKLKDVDGKKGKSVTFDLSSDGGTTLHNDQNDKAILQMLMDSGIIHG